MPQHGINGCSTKKCNKGYLDTVRSSAICSYIANCEFQILETDCIL